jgi:hypothetical protein
LTGLADQEPFTASFEPFSRADRPVPQQRTSLVLGNRLVPVFIGIPVRLAQHALHKLHMDGSDVIHFDGIRYVLTVSAAKQFDFAPDYLARLCREGKVSAKQFGRRWYVDPSAIQTFLAAQEQRRAELSRKRREEFQHVTATRSAVARADVPAPQPHSIDYAAPSSAFQQNLIASLGNASKAFFIRPPNEVVLFELHHGSLDVLKVDHDSSGAHAGAICLERQITNIRYRD